MHMKSCKLALITSTLNIVSNIAYYLELWNDVAKIYCIIVCHCQELHLINNKKKIKHFVNPHIKIWVGVNHYDIVNNITD